MATPLELPRRVCIHWSAGTYTAAAIDKHHYHYMVDGDCNVITGDFAPLDNIPPLNYGKYAAHCGGGNSYCIGVSLCSMAGYQGRHNVGKYPIKKEQFERMCLLVAKLCIKYGIKCTKGNVYTHYEFGLRNPKSDSAGKIDISFLPFAPEVEQHKIGDYIRSKISWYMLQLTKKGVPLDVNGTGVTSP